MNQFLYGALAMGAWVAGLFFIQFWRSSRERIFGFFATAFWILAVNWIALAVAAPERETRHYFYLIRLLAFVLIILGILDKNRKTAGKRDV
jgi:hypothetical protein